MRLEKFNDGGRAASHHPKQQRDCVVRAVAIVIGENYDVTHDKFAVLGRETGKATPKKLWQLEFNRLWVKKSFQAIAGEKRMTIDSFTDQHKTGRWVIQTAGHVLAVIDGVANDRCPIRWNACVYAAWKISN